MRVLLVGPEREENLSLRYLSAALVAAGHQAEIAAFDSLDDLGEVVARARGADAVGLSLCFQARAREFLTLAAALKLYAPRTPVVVGGHYATCAAAELLEHHPELDVIVLHEGEYTLVELCATGFDPARFPTIPGLAFREGPAILRSAPRPAITDLDRLPFPDRRGPVRRLAGVRTAYLMGSRGCTSSCDYCCIVTLHRMAPGPRFRQRSVASVADEMAALYRERGVRQFVFHDDNFLVPSVRKNHERLDALQAAWAERGIDGIGFTIKCRPADAERSVFEKLARMGLLRVFLGVESGSAAGLASIGRTPGARGREADVAAAEAALALCQELGISAQYTLMCFHPDATLATVCDDLDFFRRHQGFPLNFCRVETYAGTPLEARLRAAGRGRGDYLARTYTIADPAVDVASRLATRIFHERCWATDSLMEVAIGLDHLGGVLRHFHGGPGVAAARSRVQDWTVRVNRDLVALLTELVQIASETAGLEDPALLRRTRTLVERERASRAALQREGLALREHVRALGMAASARAEARVAAPRAARLRQTAVAATLAAAVLSCGGETRGDGVSEYAPPPLQDRDGDGLPDQCEEGIFGTDPALADSDGDGTPDGDENHDGGSMTNAEEQQAAGDYSCADYSDMMSEYAPSPLDDTDGDGLPDQCEQEIFGTDPELADTDGDGVADGSEDHDGGGMTNLLEQELGGGDSSCNDVNDMINEVAAAPLPAPADGDLERWARAVEGEAEPTVRGSAGSADAGPRPRRG